MGARQGMKSGTKEKDAKQEWAKRGLEVPRKESVIDMVIRGRTFIERVAAEVKESGGGGGADTARTAAEGADGAEPERRELMMVSHGGFIRTLLAGVAGAEDPEEIRNTSSSEVDVYELPSGELGYDVKRLGDTSHLTDDLQSQSKW